MNAVKESFDNLPVAACFFDRNGVVRLVNRRMLAVGAILVGSGIQTLFELHRALGDPPETVTRLDDNIPVYRFPDGTALRFAEEKIVTSEGVEYTQVTAADVTELIARQADLNEENCRLAEANRRMLRLLRQMPELVREEEMLSMKMRVHDDIGHSILAARRALLQGEGIEDIRANAAVWERSIALLCRANAQTQTMDEFEYAKSRADMLGVKLVIKGELPAKKEQRILFSQAVRECVTNCVRHAGGTELYIAFQSEGGRQILTITNNGALPRGEIAEGGGLSALRRLTEKGGGSMTVRSRPEFSLTIALPDGECEA